VKEAEAEMLGVRTEDNADNVDIELVEAEDDGMCLFSPLFILMIVTLYSVQVISLLKHRLAFQAEYVLIQLIKSELMPLKKKKKKILLWWGQSGWPTYSRTKRVRRWSPCHHSQKTKTYGAILLVRRFVSVCFRFVCSHLILIFWRHVCWIRVWDRCRVGSRIRSRI
jgi:hypothetical protein